VEGFPVTLVVLALVLVVLAAVNAVAYFFGIDVSGLQQLRSAEAGGGHDGSSGAAADDHGSGHGGHAHGSTPDPHAQHGH
jgi:hypothetical protein